MRIHAQGVGAIFLGIGISTARLGVNLLIWKGLLRSGDVRIGWSDSYFIFSRFSSGKAIAKVGSQMQHRRIGPLMRSLKSSFSCY
jgi:hypothetical protein